VTTVYKYEKSSLKYGGWGIRLRKYKEGWIQAYTTVSYERVVLELEAQRYRSIIFSTANSEEVIKVLNKQAR